MSLLVDESANELYDEPADMSYSHDDEFNTDAYFAYNATNKRPKAKGTVTFLDTNAYEKKCRELNIDYYTVTAAALGSMREFNKFWTQTRKTHAGEDKAKGDAISLLKKQYTSAMKIEYDFDRIMDCFKAPIGENDIRMMQKLRNSILRTLHSNLLSKGQSLEKTFWMKELSPSMTMPDVQQFQIDLRRQLNKVRIHIHGTDDSISWWQEFQTKFPKPKPNSKESSKESHAHIAASVFLIANMKGLSAQEKAKLLKALVNKH